MSPAERRGGHDEMGENSRYVLPISADRVGEVERKVVFHREPEEESCFIEKVDVCHKRTME